MHEPKNVKKLLSVSSVQSSVSDGQYLPFSYPALDWHSLCLLLGVGSTLPLKILLTILYGITFTFTVTAILMVAPYIETRYWPVVSKMHLDMVMTDTDNQRTRVYASFRKLRNCDYLGIAWFQGNRETGFVRVPLQLLREPEDVSSPNRPLGNQTAGPWIVSIPKNQLVDNSFVELYHHCSPLWVSRTEFYP